MNGIFTILILLYFAGLVGSLIIGFWLGAFICLALTVISLTQLNFYETKE
jgi:hypothetical protein